MLCGALWQRGQELSNEASVLARQRWQNKWAATNNTTAAIFVRPTDARKAPERAQEFDLERDEQIARSARPENKHRGRVKHNTPQPRRASRPATRMPGIRQATPLGRSSGCLPWQNLCGAHILTPRAVPIRHASYPVHHVSNRRNHRLPRPIEPSRIAAQVCWDR